MVFATIPAAVRPVLVALTLVAAATHLSAENVRFSDGTAATARSTPQVHFQRLPDGGIQPQVATDAEGRMHLLYFRGAAAAGDLYYTVAGRVGRDFGAPIRVNSQPNSVVAAGTIRGGQLAVGRNGIVHVAWNGSAQAQPRGPANPDLPDDNPYRFSAPMLYARRIRPDDGFQTQRNLMTHTYSLDGGGAIAADAQGRVYVVWHADSVNTPETGEAGRAVWCALSENDGTTFDPEVRLNSNDTGACGCCGLAAVATRGRTLLVAYRTASNHDQRDMALLRCDGKSATQALTLDTWRVPTCVMSSSAFAVRGDHVIAAWETERQVKLATIPAVAGESAAINILEPPPRRVLRKHPVVATNHRGQTILVWTEGMEWQQAGALAWQVFAPDGQPVPGAAGVRDGVPVWSFADVASDDRGDFVIIY